MPIANISMVHAELALQESAVADKQTIVIRKPVKPKKVRKKRVRFFQKMKAWFSTRNRDWGTKQVFFMGLAGFVLMILGLAATAGGLITFGCIIGLMTIVTGFIEIGHGNAHWAVIVGMLFGLFTLIGPFIALFIYLANQEP